MMINRKSVLQIVCFCLLMAVILPAEEMLDGIAATVDNRIILISEVQSQVQLVMMQMKLEQTSQTMADSLFHEILQQMIDDKLLLIEAEKDTSINISNREVEDALGEHIKRIKQQFPSEDVFLAQLTAEGLTLKELQSRYRDEVRNQLYKEMLLNKRLSVVTISSGEVKEFFNTHIDSLPRQPAGVHLAHILISTHSSEATRDSLLAYARLLQEKAKSGEDFSILAETYSDDKTAQNGGDLGWFSRGDMVPEFEEAVFAMTPSDISDIVETQFGYHIIKCTDKKGDKRRASHILIGFSPSTDDLQRSEQLADSVYNLLLEGADFEQMAALLSEDEKTAEMGGDLGWYAADDLFDEFKHIVAQLQPGDFSSPVSSQYGFHILKVIDKKSSRPLDFKEDYNDIEEIAKRYKAQMNLKKMLEQAREKYFIEVKQ